MKKIKVLLAAVILTGLTLTSCSSDDDSGGTSASIVGKWTPVKTIFKINGQSLTTPYEDNEAGCDKDYLEFVEGGAVNDVIYYKNAQNVCTQDVGDPATWVKNNNSLTVNGTFDYDGTYTIEKLTGSELRVSTSESSGGVTSTAITYFTKVN